ncbi:MAG: alpha/beta hydrolase [Planctomycetaceae bacterium]
MIRYCALGVMLAAATTLSADYPPAGAPEVLLWEKGAPGSEGVTAKEVYRRGAGETAIGSVTGIHNPSIYVFVPPKEKATGAGIVVIPGGGHQTCCVDHEGTEVARWLNSAGIAAFVLKYRLAKTEGFQYTVEGESLQDVQRALRLVRQRASEWRVDPNRLGVMGFSAGAELVCLAATRFDEANSDAIDLIDRNSSRPDYGVFLYGGPPAGMQLPKDMPPMFLTVAADDPMAARKTLELFLALQKENLPAELHVYLHGGHGFGMREVLVSGPNRGEKGFPVTTWNARLRDWLTDIKMLPQPEPPKS